MPEVRALSLAGYQDMPALWRRRIPRSAAISNTTKPTRPDMAGTAMDGDMHLRRTEMTRRTDIFAGIAGFIPPMIPLPPGPRWFRGERDVYHHDCHNTASSGACKVVETAGVS